MDHMFIMRLAALLFGGGIASCLFPGKSRMSHVLFLLLILAETAVAHATIPDGWWFLLPGVVSTFFQRRDRKRKGRKSPALPSRYGRDNYQILLLVLQFPCLWRSGSGKTKSIGKR